MAPALRKPQPLRIKFDGGKVVTNTPRFVLATDPGAVRLAQAYAVDGVLTNVGYNLRPLRVDVLVMERPRSYDDFRVAERDLDRLRARLAELRALYPGAAVVQYFPSEWKGNVPKKIHHERTWRALSTFEQQLLGHPDSAAYDHNLSDATALLLFELGRTKRGGE